jgi:hypothetical protein
LIIRRPSFLQFHGSALERSPLALRNDWPHLVKLSGVSFSSLLFLKKIRDLRERLSTFLSFILGHIADQVKCDLFPLRLRK